MAVTVISKIKQKNAADFAVVDDIDVNGGFRVVADIAERDAIPDSRRKSGMLVRTSDTGDTYEMLQDLTTWAVWGGSGGVLVYTTELLLLADTPSAGNLGFAQDTDNTYIRTGAGWEYVNSTVDGGSF